MNNPVFVLGCDRSGTTLLSLLLSQSPDLHMTLESGFIPDLYPKKDSYGDFSTSKQRWFFIRDLQTTNATSNTIAFDIFELTDKQAEQSIREAAPTDYAGAINALFSKTAEQKGKSRWGNKTPKYVHNIDLLVDLFPDAKIIHILRDPRDVAASIKKVGWTHTIKEAAQFWNDRVSDGLEGRTLGEDSYYELKYESLLKQPDQTLKNLYDWLNIDFSEEVVDQYQEDRDRMSVEKHKDLFDLIGKPIDPSRAYAWKKSMSKADIAEIEQVNRELIQKLDYELCDYYIPLSRKLYRGTFDFMINVGQKLGQQIGKKL
ncbi:sulfotransferase [Fodinibius sp. Rm-B-1B1-1]|uniref:sulfotransferase family protein n=1 Tax=Fodinibius alkaliphilus TaxID=3140241 RepID=UPI00315A4F47